jgi:RNA polymerase sigma-70 factor (ECF subfamily)
MDAVAETFAVAWRRIDRLPGGGAERSWLYAVALRVLANQRRSNRRLGNLRSKLGGTAGFAQPDPEEVLVRAEDERRLLEALARLRPADQELLRLVT